jgi:tRNA (guanosine-2'-O-)-methyltransferase
MTHGLTTDELGLTVLAVGHVDGVRSLAKGALSIENERAKGAHIVALELADDSKMLGDLRPATRRTVVLLGHERHGVPDGAWPLIDQVVEIPMVGIGASLSLAVAGSLVLYRLAGLS